MNIQGQSAIVTGGGSGLGEAVARELARLGAKVSVLDVNAAGAVFVHVQHGHLGALAGQLARHGLAEARATAGDDGG